MMNFYASVENLIYIWMLLSQKNIIHVKIGLILTGHKTDFGQISFICNNIFDITVEKIATSVGWVT